PDVLLLHEFPEIWYSWRHQMIALVDVGFHAITPYLRGYGLSDQPSKIEKGCFVDLVEAMVDLLDPFGIQKESLDSLGQTEFWYAKGENREVNDIGNDNMKQGKKWWLPIPKVPLNGLSDEARKKLLYQRDCINQIFKAAKSINEQILSEMEVPEVLWETLPKTWLYTAAVVLIMPNVEVGGLKLHVAETGSGPDVLLLHEFPEIWYSWRHQMIALVDVGFHAITPDLRGYGLSDQPSKIEKGCFVDLVEDMVDLLDPFGIQKELVKEGWRPRWEV
ncbi:hypothetical protein KI387_005157, partial [Taxus chinensis]